MLHSSDPPLLRSYAQLLGRPLQDSANQEAPERQVAPPEERPLPVIDLAPLFADSNPGRRACEEAIAAAAAEWGFFQVVSHGVRAEVVERVGREAAELFAAPFERKAEGEFPWGCYRWGSPSATDARQLSWSEAFHIPVALIPGGGCSPDLGDALEEFAEAMSVVARTVAGVLARRLRGSEGDVVSGEGAFWKGGGGSILRLNRYPPCTVGGEVVGLVAHTDSSLVTVVWQDEGGGLEVKKNSEWVGVRPKRGGLVVNIGDMFQVWSNDGYKSVEHRVRADARRERRSAAYFLCPADEAVMRRLTAEPPKYREFRFGEYRAQVQRDVACSGDKVGLRRFRIIQGLHRPTLHPDLHQGDEDMGP